MSANDEIGADVEIDAEVQRQLRVAVERCVRPVRAACLRKDRMRRELLSHLTEVYAQERARGGDDAEAAARAIERFGEPEALGRELQASVNDVERFLHQPLISERTRQRIRRQPGETAWQVSRRQATAITAWYVVVAIVMMAVAAGIAAMANTGRGMTPREAIGLLTTAVVSSVMIFAALVAQYAKAEAVLKHGYLSAASAAASLAGTAVLTAMVFGMFAVFNAMMRAPAFPNSQLDFVLWNAVVVGATFELASVGTLKDRRRAEEWDSLELGAE